MFMISEVFFVTKERELKGFTLDDVLFHLAVLFVGLAIVMPFIIRWLYKNNGYYTDLAALGPVGDFIGGSTIPFFNLASVSLLVATLLIQRRELKETQKEYKITNDTMKKQQFESTFFNMINLHHNILKEIKLNDNVGREVIKNLYNELRVIYCTEVFTKYRAEIVNDLVNGEIDKLNNITEILYFNNIYNSFMEDNANAILSGYDKYDTYSISNWNEFRDSVKKGENEEWEKSNQYYKKNFDRNIKNNLGECRLQLLELLNVKALSSNDNELLKEYNVSFFESPLYNLKFDAYEILYKKHENLIGHYYRHLYRIVKLIQSTSFGHEHEMDNEEEKRKYRGILRAQLSSFELLMIFYNVVYSEKGKKFKELLLDINFFDDHLIKTDFIWKNDNEELLKLDTPKN